MSILEKAKEVVVVRQPKTHYRSDEWQEVAIAWIKGEITLNQINVAIDKPKTGNILYGLSVALREAYREGKLKIVK